MGKLVIVCWPHSQDIMEKEGFLDHCSLINSEKGLDAYGSSAYLVDKEWYEKFISGEINDSNDEEFDEEEFDICYDDDIIFGEDVVYAV